MVFAETHAARVVVAAALVLPVVLFTTSAADPVNVVKMTALVLCAIALVTIGVSHAVRSRTMRLPTGSPAAVSALLLAGFSAAAVKAPVTTEAVVGAYGRNSGLLTYVSAIVVYLAVLVAFENRSTRIVLHALMVSGGFTAAYGLLQYLGHDVVQWSSPNPVIAALGNSNFAAAYLGICLPAFLWLAMRGRVGFHRWLLGAGGALTCLVVAVLTQAAQGVAAAAAGSAVLVAVWLLGKGPALRSRGLVGLGVAGSLVAALLAVGVAGRGPAASVFAETSSRARGWFWETAFRAWTQEPLLGLGLESFASFWLQERSSSAVIGLGGEDVTNAAHSVPLHLLATGGLLLFMAYGAFVLVTAWALVKGLRRLRGDERLLLGALGGCWTAYQVQSLVSIDQVPLVVTHYVLAGAVVVAAGCASVRPVRLPGSTTEHRPGKTSARRARSVQRHPGRAPTTADRAVLAAAVLVAAAVAWLTLLPLRADVATRSGDVAVKRGDGLQGLDAYRRATGLMPGEPTYWHRLGQLLLRAEQPDRALEAFRRGIEADPYDPRVVRGAARAAAEAGELRAAELYHRKALELHPNSPSTVIAAASFEFQQGRAGAARVLLEDALRTLPYDPTLWAALGELHAELGAIDEARYALGRAVALDPEVPGAAERLQSLDQAASS